MGRILTITNSNQENDDYRKRTIKREIIIGPTAIKFVSIAIFAILALVYLSQSTAGANRSMQIRELNDKETDLNLQKERLEVEKYRLESLGTIESNIQKTPLEPISKVNYINSSNNNLAANR